MLYPKPSQRPERFRLNSESPYYRGLMLGGLGCHPGAVLFHDNSPFGFHGTLSGYSGAGDTPAAQWAFDSFLSRQRLGYDGTDDYVLAPSINVTGPITTACWIKTGSASEGGIIDHLHNGGSFEGYAWKVNFSTNPHKMSWYSGGGWKASSTAVDDGAWHHVAFVGEGSYNFYLDGKADGTAASFSNANAWTGALQIGKSYDGLLAAMLLADPLIWNRALPIELLQPLADPGNVDLRVAGVPLILPVRRFYPTVIRPPWIRFWRAGAGQGIAVGQQAVEAVDVGHSEAGLTIASDSGQRDLYAF